MLLPPQAQLYYTIKAIYNEINSLKYGYGSCEFNDINLSK